MSLRKELKYVVFMGVLLGLSACAQTRIVSSLQISEHYLTNANREAVVRQVYQKAELLGGECKLLSEKRHYHTCTVQSGNPAFQFNVGYQPTGDFTVSVTSWLVHWWPSSKHAVNSDAQLTDQQRDLEKWMGSLVPKSTILEEIRTYIGAEM